MNGNGGSADDAWATSARHTPPGGGRGRSPPRRSRSRSPRRNGGGGEREGGGGNNPGNNLHVSGLSSKVDTKDLEAAFSKLGRVQKASVMYDPHSRESRGFGFVTMETAEEAEAAIAALNATEFFGKTLNVEKARRGRARTPTPGRYYGPPKRDNYERPYDPRPYDSRYSRGHDDDRRGGGRYREERGPRDYDRGGRDYDRGYRDYDRRYDDRRY
ncbi:RNA-binding domain-containing protein [Sistotremastrum niveocremeum HHB9708]|uniref:RNA-binding domain-containing protein n=2 Tax=Sistotremastraceae TaxID=3402574 RepID=A0A164UMC4_9AGAM|nr:RNA-binding domain-containing protein [Sistotremastrum niveocremeum HHB9708]KZT43831.1 RNA-binding domain-containing protein [Sistotremastrum suecicum HHB10207 ss-3]